MELKKTNWTAMITQRDHGNVIHVERRVWEDENGVRYVKCNRMPVELDYYMSKWEYSVDLY